MAERSLRASEVGILQLSDWNEQSDQLHVRRVKNSVPQVYRLLSAEAKALRAWLKIRGRSPGPLFPSQKPRDGGLGMNRSQVYRLFQKYCKAAGLSRVKSHPHALRHSAGVRISLASGDSAGAMDAIRDRLGHRQKQSASRYLGRTR
jgi:integrase